LVILQVGGRYNTKWGNPVSYIPFLPRKKITNLSLPLGQFGFLHTLATSFSHKSCTYKLGQFDFIRTLTHQMFILQLILHIYHIMTFVLATGAIWVGLPYKVVPLLETVVLSFKSKV